MNRFLNQHFKHIFPAKFSPLNFVGEMCLLYVTDTF